MLPLPQIENKCKEENPEFRRIFLATTTAQRFYRCVFFKSNCRWHRWYRTNFAFFFRLDSLFCNAICWLCRMFNMTICGKCEKSNSLNYFCLFPIGWTKWSIGLSNVHVPRVHPCDGKHVKYSAVVRNVWIAVEWQTLNIVRDTERQTEPRMTCHAGDWCV